MQVQTDKEHTGITDIRHTQTSGNRETTDSLATTEHRQTEDMMAEQENSEVEIAPGQTTP